MKEHWEAVIGLEIHVQLNTKTKMFGSEAYHFGTPPNSDIGIVSTGQPGSLPVINREAVTKAIRFGAAIGATVHEKSRFDRKSYFYPDNPKNYQITQFYKPILTGGSISCYVGDTLKTFAINRAHLEEDSGMLKHFTSFSGIDYNRAGVPLLEIVSEPCFRSAKEASCYAMQIKAIMEYIDSSDCNMDEGSLRIDANVSIRPVGTPLRNKLEIKNINSFYNMEMAIEEAIDLQSQFYEKNREGVFTQSTYRFDPEGGKIILMRSKEGAEDYRYFPEPDLPPLHVERAEIENISKSLPELPLARLDRYLNTFGFSKQQGEFLVSKKALSDFFEQVILLAPHPKAVLNWIIVEFTGRLKEKGLDVWNTIPIESIAEIVKLTQSGTVTGKMAKEIADQITENPKLSPLSIIEKNQELFTPVLDQASIEQWISETIEKNPQAVADFKMGKEKAFAFLIGQIMKLSKGKASPEIANNLLKKKLESL